VVALEPFQEQGAPDPAARYGPGMVSCAFACGCAGFCKGCAVAAQDVLESFYHQPQHRRTKDPDAVFLLTGNK